MTDHTQGFEPARYLTKLSGKDYLEVKWRLVWLRHDHPDATINTEAHEISPQVAIFKATITIPGAGGASGYGSEIPADFRDYIEKAETKAIGRALGALGYGTQFTPDFDFGAEQGRVVDSPVDIARTRGWNGGQPQQPQQQGMIPSTTNETRVFSTENPATERQMSFLQSVAQEAGIDQRNLGERIKAVTGGSRDLTRREASALIDQLKSARQNGGGEGANPKAREAGKRTQLHMRLKELVPNEQERERLLRSTLNWGYGTQTTTDLNWEQMDELLQSFTTDLQGIKDEVDAREAVDGPPPIDYVDNYEEVPF